MSEKVSGIKVSKRIRSLDLIRGVAVLGILLMNISSFSMVGTAYINPTLMGGLEGMNKWVHIFNFVFANQKFMTIFSILFGAGILLFTDRIASKGLGAAKYFYRRLFFLLIFGLIHAYLIWMGDILVAYSICGAIAFLFRGLKARSLLIISLIIFSIPLLLNISWFSFVSVDEINNTSEWWAPTQAEIVDEVAKTTGSFSEVQTLRMEGALELQTFYFGIHTFWRALSMMLFGMFLYKSNVLQAIRSHAYYLKLFAGCFTIGLALCAHGVYKAYAQGWDAAYGFVYHEIFNYLGSLFLAVSYIALICLWSNASIANRVKVWLESTGRMAFTIYILSSIICTFIFYGYGLSYFGQFDRLDQLILVIVLWVFLVSFAQFYSTKIGQGPLEKLWRKLTYYNAKY